VVKGPFEDALCKKQGVPHFGGQMPGRKLDGQVKPAAHAGCAQEILGVPS
jgi:hypothetical protein